MVRQYKKKSKRSCYGQHLLKTALEAISQGQPLIRVSREFNIPARTLRRHRDNKVKTPGKIILGRYSKALSDEAEEALVEHVIHMQRVLYGLSGKDVRKLAFDIAVKYGTSHPFNKHTKMAGPDWLSGFLKRHNEITLRQPTATSLARATGFNRENVQEFFTIYREILTNTSIEPARIFNMDETGVSTVQKPGKILAQKGARKVGKLTSGERGTLVTVICAMSATGIFVAPFFVFPRKRMNDALMEGAPVQSEGHTSDNGWSDSTLFLKWLDHFKKYVNASKENPVILILDGHHSHKTLDAVTFARDNGITMITLPPHCTHYMQPLDKSFFKALKTAYNAEADSWMVNHSGERIELKHVARIFGKAYERSCQMEKAVNGFRSCGLWPYDPNVFGDECFAAVDELSSDPQDSGESDATAPPRNTGQGRVADVNVSSSTPVPNPSNSDDQDAITVPQPTAINASDLCSPSTSGLSPTSNCKRDAEIIIECLSPSIKATKTSVRARRTQQATVITSSPYKQKLEKLKLSKENKDRGVVNKSKKKSKKSSSGPNIIKTNPDGRCFFRSLVTGMNTDLQTTTRDQHGIILDPVLNNQEQNEADALRSRVIAHMLQNFKLYESFDEETVNADLPDNICYESVQDRIAAMASPIEMIGELEIFATCRTIGKEIIVYANGQPEIKYGTEFSLANGKADSTLTLKYTRISADVGHYDYVRPMSSQFVTPSTLISQADRTAGTSAKIATDRPKPRERAKSRNQKKSSRPTLTKSTGEHNLRPKRVCTEMRSSRSTIEESDIANVMDDDENRQIDSDMDDSDTDPWYCCICDEERKENMVTCTRCQTWMHTSCAGGIEPNWECDMCE